MFKHADRVLHTRREETGSVVVNEALTHFGDRVWVVFDGYPDDSPWLVSAHLLRPLKEQRVAVSAYDWNLLVDIARKGLPGTFTPVLNAQLLDGIVERAQRIE